MAENLEDILSDKPETKDPVEKQIEKQNYESKRVAHRDKEQEAQGRIRDPQTGQYAAKPEPEVKPEAKAEAKPEVKPEPKPEPVKQELTEKERGFLRGLEEERKKRQELERKLQALEESKPKEPEKKFYDDPDAALARQTQALEANKREVAQMLTTQRISTSEMIARRSHTDFDEKVSAFEELLKTTPGLYSEWVSSPDPAEFAYQACKNHLEIKEAGSIDALRAKIEKETRLKIEAELKDKADRLAAEKAALPPSLTDAKSTGSNNRPVWGGPTPLDAILK